MVLNLLASQFYFVANSKESNYLLVLRRSWFGIVFGCCLTSLVVFWAVGVFVVSVGCVMCVRRISIGMLFDKMNSMLFCI